MKQELQIGMKVALVSLQKKEGLTIDIPNTIQIDRPRDASHGDYSSNIALVLAKVVRTNPKTLAKMIIDAFPASPLIERIEMAGPGFINFFITPMAEQGIISDILNKGVLFGHSEVGEHKKVIVEFVSTNPTGPLHVGHGRQAAYGASLSNLLEAIGYDVHREYYINDAGRQMDIVAVSVWLRYLEALGEEIVFPTKGYQGDYIKDIAKTLLDQYGDQFKRLSEEVYRDIPEDAIEVPSENEEEKDGQERKAEVHIDALIEREKILLKEDFNRIHQRGLADILADIRQDLEEFGVTFDEWFSEKTVRDSGAIEKSLVVLREKDCLYEKDGAVWFRSTRFGDTKDHVVVRRNGSYTYLTPDIAYHWNKMDRGFERIIDVLGSDHHGYVPRLRAAVQALGLNAEAMCFPLIQFVTLYRGGKQVKMSTRKASYITLRQLRSEVGNDAAKFFYIMRKNDQHMDFDLELAKSTSSDNPLYYIQYAHARICSVFRQLKERGLTFEQSLGLAALDRLTTEHEKALIAQLSRYPETILSAAEHLEPHRLANYCRDLAHAFHTYYNAEQFIVSDTMLCHARLCLIRAVKQVVANGLRLLGVSAPEEM